MVCIAIDRPAEREVACARAGDSLESDILLDEVTELVVRYLEPPPADSASALSNPAM
jgi:hypothetical protein